MIHTVSIKSNLVHSDVQMHGNICVNVLMYTSITIEMPPTFFCSEYSLSFVC